MKNNMYKRITNLCLTALLTTAASVSATTWTGLGDGTSWNDSSNWEPATVPGETTVINIGDTATVTYPSGNLVRKADTTLSGNADLFMTSGRFLEGNGTACTFTVKDNATFTQQSGDYFIVGQNTICAFDQLGGTVNLSLNRGFFMTDNSAASGSEYNLYDGELNVTFVSRNADWNADFPGHNSGKGIFNLYGGTASFVNTLENDRQVWLRYGSEVNINGGEFNFDNFTAFVIGRDDDFNESALTINGGILDFTNECGDFILGGQNSTGRLEINGGKLNINNMYVGNGASSTGGYVDQNGGDITVNGTITLGVVDTAVDTYYTMNAGTLTADNIELGANAAETVVFTFNGGVITLNGDKSALGNEAWFVLAEGTIVDYDEVSNTTTFTRLPFAHNPTPVSGAIDYGTPVEGGLEVTLSWNTGLGTDNTNAGLPNPEIEYHNIYFQSNTDPNEYLLAEVPADGNASASYGPIVLDYDTTYYWHVDEITSEPNTISGGSWSFSTPASVPVISAITPAKAMYFSGESVTITASYKTISPATKFTWFINGNEIDTNDSNISIDNTDSNSVLTIVSIEEANIGSYTCIVTNSAGDSETSEPAVIDIKRVVAWYEFNNNLNDSANGNNASTEAEIIYTDSLEGLGTALSLTAADEAKIYIDRPVQEDFTIELWVKTASSLNSSDWGGGIGLIDGDLAGVLDDFGATVCNGNFAFGIGNLDRTAFSSTVINDNQWHYCVATRNAATGEIIVYVDGSMDGSANGATSIKNSAEQMTIGSVNSGGNYLEGLIDEIKFSNYIKTEMEIATTYNTITGKPVCITSVRPDTKFDLNGDCIINILDFADFAGNWLESGLYDGK